MKKKLFLYIPLVYILLLFALDKIFLLDYFNSEFLQTGNVIYYKHREILYEKYKNYLNEKKDKKNIIAMGDSRAYAYSSLAFQEDRKSKYEIYNFSAPQAVVAYSLFWLEKFILDGTKPDLIFLVLSPEGFDDTKGLLHKPFFRLGASEEFIQKYKSWTPEDDLNEYYLDKMIVTRKIELNIKLLLNRFKSKKMNEYKAMYNPEMQLLMLTKGEQLAYTTYKNDEDKLEKDAYRLEKVYLNNFKVYDTQFLFLEEILKKSKENEIQVFLIFPKVYKTYRKAFEKKKITTEWWNRVKKLSEKYNMNTFNLNDVSDCELFYDSSHQSTMCFGEQVNYLVDEYEKLKKEK